MDPFNPRDDANDTNAFFLYVFAAFLRRSSVMYLNTMEALLSRLGTPKTFSLPDVILAGFSQILDCTRNASNVEDCNWGVGDTLYWVLTGFDETRVRRRWNTA